MHRFQTSLISGEWYSASQPLGITINEGYPECNVSRKRFLLLHLYPCTLLLLAFFYGMTVLKIKRNFNEGRWITCATMFIVPVFAAWSLVYYFAPTQFHDPSVAVSVTAVAGILLAAIFVPKMHTIAHQSKMKLANLDLYRSHSDSTVFTGFSEGFIPPFPPSKKHQKYYPIYAVPPPPFMGPGPGGLPPPPFMGPHPPHRVDFNGLNYVSTHQRRGPRLTTYGEWTQSRGSGQNSGGGGHGHDRGRRRHSSSPLRNEAGPAAAMVVKSPRSKSSSKDSHSRESRGRPRKRTSNATPQHQQSAQVATDPQHYLRFHQHNSTQLQPQPPDGVGVSSRLSSGISSGLNSQLHHHEVNVLSSSESPVQRKEHSRSPSDGMILTASGLSGLQNNGLSGLNSVLHSSHGHNHRDTTTILQDQSNNSDYHNNSNQVVIVDGPLNNDQDVYLTTS